MEQCEHFDQIHKITPSDSGCKECMAIGEPWVKLRICLTCGHVGGCDSSNGRHATKHFEETGHAIMQTFEPDEDWLWCYEHKKMFQTEGKKYTLPTDDSDQEKEEPSE